MNVSWARCFAAVVEQGGFAEASERLYTTQSTVSKQVMALERELGVRLLDRSGRRAMLTEAGRALLPEIRRLIEADDALRRAARTHQQTERQPCIRILSTPVMATCGITALVTDFVRAYPSFQVELGDQETAAMPMALKDGTCDLFVTRCETVEMGLLHSLPLCTDRMAALLPITHRLAQQERISLAELSGESFLLLSKETGMLDFCLRQCEAAGFTPRVAATGTHTGSLCEMVAAGMGVSLVMPRTMGLEGRRDVRCLPLAEDIFSTVALLWQRDRALSDAAQCFIDFAANSLGEQGGILHE